jgi:hypothetical protein
MTTSAGMLAYDPERLGQLASVLGAASDALSALRCGDPEAQPALAAAAGAGTALEQWRLTALAIAGCAVLTDYRPLGPATPDLQHAAEYVLAQLYGWRLTTDATGTARSVPPAMEAASLGYLLSTGQVTLDTAEQLDVLQSRLGAVVADPAGRSAFAANLSPQGAAELVAVLGHQRAVAVEAAGGPAAIAAGADADALATIASIDAVLASIATAIVDVGGSLEAAESALAGLSPYDAALLIAQLDAPDQLLLDLSTSTMARYFAAFGTDQAASGWELPDGLGYGIGDLLFPRVTSLPPALAAEFVTGLGSMSFELLTHTVHDAATAGALVARATDPAAVTAGRAGTVLVPLLRFLRDPPPTPSAPANVDWLHEAVNGMRPHLGGLIAPWLLQFTAHPEDWAWAEEEAAETFVFVIEDPQAWQDLEAGVDRWRDSILTLDSGDVGDAQNALEDLGLLIGGLNRLLTERAGQQAIADRFLWDLFVQQAPTLLNKATKAAGVTGIPARILARITDFAIAAGADALEQHGAPGVPPPLADTLRQLELGADETLAFTAYLGMGLKIETLIERGDLPPDTDWPPAPLPEVCASGGYIAATNRWLDDTIHDDVLRDVVRAGRGAFIAAGQSADRCNEFRYG